MAGDGNDAPPAGAGVGGGGGGGGGWRRMGKLSLGLPSLGCLQLPRTHDDDRDRGRPPTVPSSPAAASSGPLLRRRFSSFSSGGASSLLPSPSSSPKSKVCAICLMSMKPGQGQALFTAECSHTFHFQCIATNVQHGSCSCPVCRTKWKEIPFQNNGQCGIPDRKAMVGPNGFQGDGHINILRPLPRTRSSNRMHHVAPFLPNLDHSTFDDDEPLQSPSESAKESQQEKSRTVKLQLIPEFPEVLETASEEIFTALIHLKAPIVQISQPTGSLDNCGNDTSRAPVDLITVLDVSGSMAGTKIALLKRAMGFVIQNLGPNDRLSVIAFSSSARRLFPLIRMSESGRETSLAAINSLAANGGTNIADGLRHGFKVIQDRKQKNPVCSIILLSDGQDTYIVCPTTTARTSQPDYWSLLPPAIRESSTQHVPVHVFGFGTDHDSAALHSIAQNASGTFSFIETESAIQDAFALCIGGLLSVVAQGMRVNVRSEHPAVQLSSIKSGSYASVVSDDRRNGHIDVGDLYADEERDFLMCMNVPQGEGETSLVSVGCVYRDPMTKAMVNLDNVPMTISRSAFVSVQGVSIEVDRQRNRLHAAEVMAEARAAAESGDLSQAVSLLEACRRQILDSPSGQLGERLCLALDAELKEMQERMANRQRYEASGRAYVLSGLSSHSWQRATSRGDLTDSESVSQSYQTPTMVDMLHRSQTMSRGDNNNNHQTRQMRHAKSFPARPQPR